MADHNTSGRLTSLPPPAPPLPPARPAAWKRLVAPLGFGQTLSSPVAPSQRGVSQPERPDPVRLGSHPPLPSQTAAHRTGIPIAALDCNGSKTHAVLAGQEILKTIHVVDRKVTEDVNLRAAVTAYKSAHNNHSSGRPKLLPATEVKWSHGIYGHLIATAAVNGPIVVYDINKTAEVDSLHEHRSQVHRLAFDPNLGRYLLSGSQDGTIKCWDLRVLGQGKGSTAIQSSRRYPGRVGAVRDVRWSPVDAFEFVTASDNGVIQKWDMRNSEYPVLRINAHEKPCTSIDWHPDGRHVVSAGFDRYLKVWDFQSRDRRQTPSFQLRAPHAIMHVRWRPACWSAELTESGHWQSTQLVTSYTKDDPRIHIWDLRRPQLPFRELDRYNSPATDLLWVSKDLLWTVGNEGMFTQTDVTYTTPLHKQIPPCALKWTDEGEYTTFVEDRSRRAEMSGEDPSAGFLSVPQQKLSGEEEGGTSRSLTDEETPFESMHNNSLKRKQSKSTSARTIKSQSNTPPTTDPFPVVLPLEKAVFERKDLFNNNQVGLVGGVPGAVVEPEIAKYLAYHYSPPLSEEERKAHPNQILARLEAAFKSNADTCDRVSMHRMAQSWRILAAVIVPELQDWADKNRAERLQKLSSEAAFEARGAGPLTSVATKASTAPIFASPKSLTITKPINSILRGIKEEVKVNSLRDMDSTSNMTTPLAQPLPDSPSSDRTEQRSRFSNLDESVEGLPPLPPSLISSHATAAAAAKALQDASSDASMTPPSSPEKNRKQLSKIRADTASPNLASVGMQFPSSKVLPQPIQQTAQSRRQEDRRAALKDYKAQARPLLTFDRPVNINGSGSASGVSRRDSADSFLMFSASTDSSNKIQSSIGVSVNSPDSRFKGSITFDQWQGSSESENFEPSSPQWDDGSVTRRFLEPPVASTGRSTGSLLSQDSVSPASTNRPNGLRQTRKHGVAGDPFSISPGDPFYLGSDAAPTQTKEKPITSPREERPRKKTLEPRPSAIPSNNVGLVEDFNATEYILQDFRPLDWSEYVTKLPFAWSALPLIAHSLAFDLSLGAACGQFSAALLMLVYPYFLRPSSLASLPEQSGRSGGLVQRLMQPESAQRTVESIFRSYAQYLQRMGWFVPLAELRKFCHGSGFTALSKVASDANEERSIHGNDRHLVSMICQRCHTPLQTGVHVCRRCWTPHAVCPICSSWHSPNTQSQGWMGNWTFCHSCGHSAHAQCMQEWLIHPYSEGICPSQGCGCDCGPGSMRSKRIERQVQQEEENKLIRGSGGSGQLASSPMDNRRATPSPAVQKARNVLREGDRATQSGDERGPFGGRSRGSRSSGVGGPVDHGGSPYAGVASQSQRKSVRLITPREEQGQTQ